MNKLQELVNDIHKMSGIGKITLTERIQALLTSEVEKERERLLKEVEEKLLKRDEVVKTAKTVFDGTKECIYLARATLKAEQRKALSDIGGRNED